MSENKKIIFMKKYCLNNIMIEREQMEIHTLRPDWMRVIFIKIWLEQYFLVETRFGEDE